MKTTPQLLFAVTAAIFSLGAFAHTAQAQAPTLITTAPYTITTPGVYQLGANLVYAGNGSSGDAIIKIVASNVTLDFNGHYISGPSNTPATALYGVYANEAGNLTIRNGTIAFCQSGIYLNGNGNTTSLNINQRVENMLISYCYFSGVYLSSVRNSDVLGCRISLIGPSPSGTAVGISCSGPGIKLSNNEITGVTASISGNAFGIFSLAGTFSVGNTISNCYNGIYGGKYQNNLTNGCTTPFTNGVDAGANN